MFISQASSGLLSVTYVFATSVCEIITVSVYMHFLSLELQQLVFVSRASIKLEVKVTQSGKRLNMFVPEMYFIPEIFTIRSFRIILCVKPVYSHGFVKIWWNTSFVLKHKCLVLCRCWWTEFQHQAFVVLFVYSHMFIFCKALPASRLPVQEWTTDLLMYY